MLNHRLALPTPRRSLSARLLVLTVLFVMIGEVLIYVPSISRFRLVYLQERVAAAHQASIAVEAALGGRIAPELAARLLEHVRVQSIALNMHDASYLMLGAPGAVDGRFDLADAEAMTLIRDAFDTLLHGRRAILVSSPSPADATIGVEITLDERDLHAAMLDYSWRILVLSIIISLIAASLVFLTLQRTFVRPLRRLIDDLAGFREAPEDQSRSAVPGARFDEIGVAQRAVADMQTALRAALRQRSRLAAIGAAVAKIGHDLKNILSTASLVSDRLAMSDDPEVKRQATLLMGAIDRAVVLTADALRFARADEPELRLTRFDMRALVDDVGEALGLSPGGAVALANAVPEPSFVRADRDQVFRVLLNLGRNATEAMKASGRLTVTAEPREDGLRVTVIDDGPGLPAKAREHLFEAFAGGARDGGTGLGLAIARELVRAHGGELVLEATGPSGTRFAFTLPKPYAGAGGLSQAAAPGT